MTPIKIELTTEDEAETFKWIMQNFDIFNQARKVRLGRILLDVDISGKIKSKYEIAGEGLSLFFQKPQST